ncbi:MAG: hypothetical protein Q9202_001486 [Teloschistes flavicans]
MPVNLLQRFRSMRSKGDNRSTQDKSVGGGSSSKTSRTTVGMQRQRVPGLNPKLRMYCQDKTKPAEQAAFCLPSCPLEDEDMHNTGLYLHQGKPNNDLSFLFGANNPPPDIWLVHEKLMSGEASEEEEELILEFLNHHPFQPGKVSNGIWWTRDDPAQLIMEGHPLSHMAPEVEPITFNPIRVAPIKPAGRETTFRPVSVESCVSDN